MVEHGMAVDAGHPNVEQHDVRSKFAHRPNGLDAVVSNRRLMTERRHHLVEDVRDLRLVVNDQDADLVVGHPLILTLGSVVVVGYEWRPGGQQPLEATGDGAGADAPAVPVRRSRQMRPAPGDTLDGGHALRLVSRNGIDARGGPMSPFRACSRSSSEPPRSCSSRHARELPSVSTWSPSMGSRSRKPSSINGNVRPNSRSMSAPIGPAVTLLRFDAISLTAKA